MAATTNTRVSGTQLNTWRASTGTVSSTSSSTETVLWSVVIPAGTVGPNSKLTIEPTFACTANTNSKTHRVLIGQDVASGAVIFARTRTSASHFGEVPILNIQMRGAVNSQVLTTASSGAYTSPMSSAVSTYGIDFSIDQTIFFTGSCAVGTDFDRLEAAFVEISG